MIIKKCMKCGNSSCPEYDKIDQKQRVLRRRIFLFIIAAIFLLIFILK